jgi:hypothetical protein
LNPHSITPHSHRHTNVQRLTQSAASSFCRIFFSLLLIYFCRPSVRPFDPAACVCLPALISVPSVCLNAAERRTPVPAVSRGWDNSSIRRTGLQQRQRQRQHSFPDNFFPTSPSSPTSSSCATDAGFRIRGGWHVTSPRISRISYYVHLVMMLDVGDGLLVPHYLLSHAS